MRNMFRAAVVGIVMACTAPVAAGPFEDALAAYKSGEDLTEDRENKVRDARSRMLIEILCDPSRKPEALYGQFLTDPDLAHLVATGETIREAARERDHKIIEDQGFIAQMELDARTGNGSEDARFQAVKDGKITSATYACLSALAAQQFDKATVLNSMPAPFESRYKEAKSMLSTLIMGSPTEGLGKAMQIMTTGQRQGWFRADSEFEVLSTEYLRNNPETTYEAYRDFIVKQVELLSNDRSFYGESSVTVDGKTPEAATKPDSPRNLSTTPNPFTGPK